MAIQLLFMSIKYVVDSLAEMSSCHAMADAVGGDGDDNNDNIPFW